MFDLPIMAIVLLCAGIAWWIDRKPERERKRVCKAHGYKCVDCIHAVYIWRGSALGVSCEYPDIPKTRHIGRWG